MVRAAVCIASRPWSTFIVMVCSFAVIAASVIVWERVSQISSGEVVHCHKWKCGLWRYNCGGSRAQMGL